MNLFFFKCFYSDLSPFKQCNPTLTEQYPSICLFKANKLLIQNEHELTHIYRQLMSTLLICLKSQGSIGLHTQLILNNDRYENEIIEKLFLKLNFKQIDLNGESDTLLINTNQIGFKLFGRKMLI